MNKKLTWVGINNAGPVIHHRSFYTCLNGALFYGQFAGLHIGLCVWKNYIVIFHTITLEIMHSHPRYHIHVIISSVVITDWPCVATYQMYFVWSARRCWNPHWLRAAQSRFGTAPAPGHVRQVNNLVFWIDDATATRGQLGGRIRFGYGQCGGESGTEFE